MMMVKEAWDNAKPATIKACWDHTKIQWKLIVIYIYAPGSSNILANDLKNEQTWSILCDFATIDMTLPDAEMTLKNLWGDNYSEA